MFVQEGLLFITFIQPKLGIILQWASCHLILAITDEFLHCIVGHRFFDKRVELQYKVGHLIKQITPSQDKSNSQVLFYSLENCLILLKDLLCCFHNVCNLYIHTITTAFSYTLSWFSISTFFLVPFYCHVFSSLLDSTCGKESGMPFSLSLAQFIYWDNSHVHPFL